MIAAVGDIEITFRRIEDGGDGHPKEAYRLRDVQVQDKDGVYIRDSVFKKLQRQINAIFNEDQSKSKPRPRKKRTKVSENQGKLFQ